MGIYGRGLKEGGSREVRSHRKGRRGKVVQPKVSEMPVGVARASEKGASAVDLVARLMDASKSDRIALIRRAFKDPVRVNARNNAGNSALHLAVDLGDIDLVALLLQRKADPDQQNMAGSTPLHFAASRGLDVIAQLLIDKGARSDVENSAGETPLAIAQEIGESEVAELLLGAGRYPSP